MKSASELKDLDVDRVDGVDKPATGRNFLLFKSEGGADAIMKGYGAACTAGALVLKALRTDKSCTVSRKSAVALNGLAQILGQDALFVGKSVPTQPYEIKEDVDVDSRGPADEDLGGNFTPRSMPGSMVGSVQFRMKDADEADDEDASKDKVKTKAAYDDDAAKAKAATAKAKAKAKADDAAAEGTDDEMDPAEQDARGVAASKKSAEAFDAAVAKAVAKSLQDMGLAVPVSKSEDDEPQPARRPRSRQIEEAEPVVVKKDSGLRMGVSFANIAFNTQK